MTDDVNAPEAILVDTSPAVGSARLAAALQAQDPEAIGQALRHDYVVVPLLRAADGALQICLFGGDGATPAEPGYELCLFSSTETFARFIGDAPERELALRAGPSLIPFLEAQRELVSLVTFDPAGPWPMSASPDDVLAALAPRPEDDEVAWVTDPDAATVTDDARGLPVFPSDRDPTASRVVGFDLPLAGDWFPITLNDADERDAQIAGLVHKQLSTVGPAPVLRAELTTWLTRTCERAAGGGAQFLAYLLQRSKTGALALNLVLYWHELGPAVGGLGHLDAMGKRLKEGLTREASLVTATTPAGPLIRHTRVVAGGAELGASGIPLLLVDYWLEFPDKRGLCLVTFSSPQAELGDILLTLMDNIILSGAWVMESVVDEHTEG